MERDVDGERYCLYEMENGKLCQYIELCLVGLANSDI